MAQLILLTVTFVLLSGLVAMVDAAVLSVSRAETEEEVAHQRWGALQLRTITAHLTRSVIVIVIVTNTINVLGPILIGQTAVAIYGASAVGWMTIILTLGTIIFSEIIPKSLGTHYATQISRFAALPILTVTYGLFPLVVVLDRFTRLFRRGRRHVGTEGQIRALTTLGRRAGYIEPDEGALVHRVFILNDRTAKDIMNPRTTIESLRAGATLADAAQEILRSRFSRYPMFGASLDDYAGLVLARDVLEAVVDGRGDQPLTSVARSGLTVDADQRCDDLLLQFRLRRLHLAVVQRAGATIGLVTLEDVLEELVGEITDERDRAF